MENRAYTGEDSMAIRPWNASNASAAALLKYFQRLHLTGQKFWFHAAVIRVQQRTSVNPKDFYENTQAGPKAGLGRAAGPARQAEAVPAAGFIRACLHLNPEERSLARDLLAHPWLEKAFMSC